MSDSSYSAVHVKTEPMDSYFGDEDESHLLLHCESKIGNKRNKGEASTIVKMLNAKHEPCEEGHEQPVTVVTPSRHSALLYGLLNGKTKAVKAEERPPVDSNIIDARVPGLSVTFKPTSSLKSPLLSSMLQRSASQRSEGQLTANHNEVSNVRDDLVLTKKPGNVTLSEMLGHRKRSNTEISSNNKRPTPTIIKVLKKNSDTCPGQGTQAKLRVVTETNPRGVTPVILRKVTQANSGELTLAGIAKTGCSTEHSTSTASLSNRINTTNHVFPMNLSKRNLNSTNGTSKEETEVTENVDDLINAWTNQITQRVISDFSKDVNQTLNSFVKKAIVDNVKKSLTPMLTVGNDSAGNQLPGELAKVSSLASAMIKSLAEKCGLPKTGNNDVLIPCTSTSETNSGEGIPGKLRNIYVTETDSRKITLAKSGESNLVSSGEVHVTFEKSSKATVAQSRESTLAKSGVSTLAKSGEIIIANSEEIIQPVTVIEIESDEDEQDSCPNVRSAVKVENDIPRQTYQINLSSEISGQPSHINLVSARTIDRNLNSNVSDTGINLSSKNKDGGTDGDKSTGKIVIRKEMLINDKGNTVSSPNKSVNTVPLSKRQEPTPVILSKTGPQSRTPEISPAISFLNIQHVQDQDGKFLIFSCDICGKRFQHHGTLVVHKRTHLMESGNSKYECDVCGKVCTAKRYLQIHMRTHERNRPVICNKTFTCEICQKVLTTEENLNIHKRMHLGLKLYECRTCKTSFNRRSQLSIHLQSHTGKKEFKCGTCDKSFSHYNSLSTHLKIHEEKKPYNCSKCGQGFTRKAHYQRHMRKENGERPFRCDQCGKDYLDKTSLKTHKCVVTNGDIFFCRRCGKGYSTENSLQVHMQFHTGERGYDCSHCKERFELKDDLTQHVISNHKAEAWDLQVKGQTGTSTCTAETSNFEDDENDKSDVKQDPGKHDGGDLRILSVSMSTEEDQTEADQAMSMEENQTEADQAMSMEENQTEADQAMSTRENQREVYQQEEHDSTGSCYHLTASVNHNFKSEPVDVLSYDNQCSNDSSEAKMRWQVQIKSEPVEVATNKDQFPHASEGRYSGQVQIKSEPVEVATNKDQFPHASEGSIREHFEVKSEPVYIIPHENTNVFDNCEASFHGDVEVETVEYDTIKIEYHDLERDAVIGSPSGAKGRL